MRFAWWGAEEAGLVGSTEYVADQVADGGIEDIEAKLDFDMVGSPNFVRFVYDGDASDTAPPTGGAPAGSAQIEQCSCATSASEGLVTDPTAFDGRSDYGPFIANGGAGRRPVHRCRGHQDGRQEAIYGGFAGLAYDPCYHQACDTFFNLNHPRWTRCPTRRPTPPGSRQGQEADQRGARSRRRRSRGRRASAAGPQVQGPVPGAVTQGSGPAPRGGHELKILMTAARPRAAGHAVN